MKFQSLLSAEMAAEMKAAFAAPVRTGTPRAATVVYATVAPAPRVVKVNPADAGLAYRRAAAEGRTLAAVPGLREAVRAVASATVHDVAAAQAAVDMGTANAAARALAAAGALVMRNLQAAGRFLVAKAAKNLPVARATATKAVSVMALPVAAKAVAWVANTPAVKAVLKAAKAARKAIKVAARKAAKAIEVAARQSALVAAKAVAA